MNKKNNKGFSLVELIVVVAIMAVLVGVLAPAYLRYVEKSRYQKDCSAVAEVEEAIKIAVAEENVFKSMTAGTPYHVTVPTSGAPTSTDAATLVAEVVKTIPTVELTSKTITSAVTITVTVSANGSVTVTNDIPTLS